MVVGGVDILRPFFIYATFMPRAEGCIMIKNNLLVKLLLLLFIGLGFVGITSVVNLFAISRDTQDHEFSYLRRTADEFWENENYESAADAYRKLAESDENNCMAHFQYARGLILALEQKLEKTHGDRGTLSVDEVLSSDSDRIDEAILALEDVLEFPQFRNIARLRLSILHGLKGDRDAAIESGLAAKNGGMNVDELARFYRLYHCLEIYSEIVQQQPAGS